MLPPLASCRSLATTGTRPACPPVAAWGLLQSTLPDHERPVAGDHANERRLFAGQLPQDRRHGAPAHPELGRQVIHRR